MAKSDLNWIEVDTSGFTGNVKSAYSELKEAQKLTAAKREAFENAFKAKAAEAEVFDTKTEELVLSYRFGKLSVAAREKGATASRSAKPMLKIG